jgi:hypothetical protein
MRENAFNCCVTVDVMSLLSGHVTLPYSCVIQVFIDVAWQQRGEAMRRDERLVHGSTRLGSALLGTARSKHRFIYYCVIAGACFDVTVLVWHKYVTILIHLV